MRYSVRDLLGHFVKPTRREGRMCPHACCKGRRPHPDRFPVLLPKDVVRHASDKDLVRHLEKESVGRSGEAVTQVVNELDRREKSTARAQARRARATGRRQSRQSEYRDYLETEWVAAEAATNGQMVNRRGRARDIDPRSLWTANERTRKAYASEELRRYWDNHPIVGADEFTGGAEAQRRGGTRRRESRLYGVYGGAA